MTTNYVQDGDVLEHTAAASISAGDVVELANVVGVALADAASGEKVSVRVDGVFTLAKTTGTAWNQGDVLDWDTSTAKFGKGITPATGDITKCAVAAADAASGDATGKVLLRAIPGTIN